MQEMVCRVGEVLIRTSNGTKTAKSLGQSFVVCHIPRPQLQLFNETNYSCHYHHFSEAIANSNTTWGNCPCTIPFREFDQYVPQRRLVSKE